jgi:hypothetical protein
MFSDVIIIIRSCSSYYDAPVLNTYTVDHMRMLYFIIKKITLALESKEIGGL